MAKKTGTSIKDQTKEASEGFARRLRENETARIRILFNMSEEEEWGRLDSYFIEDTRSFVYGKRADFPEEVPSRDIPHFVLLRSV